MSTPSDAEIAAPLDPAAGDPERELARLAALRRYDVLDTDPEPIFDDLVALASAACGTPMALLTLVDARRQWFKARVGLSLRETPREMAFCRFALDRQDPLIVHDAALDARFVSNPLVTGEPFLRAYAGAPLITQDGHVLGTLCVLDDKPRTFTPEQLTVLQGLARQAVDQLERRRELRELRGELALRDALSAAEERWRLTWDHSPVGMALVSPRGRLVRVNRALCQTLGRDAEQLMASSFDELTAADEIASGGTTFDDLVARGPLQHQHVRFRGRNDATVLADIAIALVQDVHGRPMHYVLHVHDVTEHLTREQALAEAHEARAAEAAFRQGVLDSLDVGVIACDAHGRLTLFNPTARRWHGLRDADASLSPKEWSNAYELYEIDGTTPLTTDRIPLFQTLTKGRVTNREIVIKGPGQPDRQVVCEGREIRVEGGRLLGAVVSMTDVTEDRRRTRELVSARDALSDLARDLRQSNADLEQFAAAASHDLRAPIIVVNGFLDLLAEEYSEVLDNKARDWIDRSQRAGRRMAGLIDALLDHSKLGSTGDEDRVAMDEILDHVLADLDEEIAARQATVHRPAPLPQVRGSASLLYQLLQNLVGNAVRHHHLAHPPVIEISARLRPDPDRPCWVFSVSDNGPGIKPEDRARAFDMFATIGDAQDSHHGIGLATCARILQRHQGRIWIEDTKGGGTTMCFDLPVA